MQRRGLCASHDLDAGHVITNNDLVALRPCMSDGFAPYKAQQLIGRKISCKVIKGENITKKMLV